MNNKLGRAKLQYGRLDLQMERAGVEFGRNRAYKISKLMNDEQCREK